MRIIFTALIVFLLAFLASCLLEFDFIAKNWVRYALTVLLVISILSAGVYLLKAMRPKNEE
jgi:hypothetical protein